MPQYIVKEKDVESIASSAFPGTAAKILAGDPETKTHTALTRWDPGVEFPPHAHPCLEQIYVLEGECECEGEVYGPGTLFLCPAGQEHGPFKVGDQGWLTLITMSGRSGLEEVPEYKERFQSLGLL